VLRAITREPDSLEAWITEVGRVRGEDNRLDAAVDEVLTELADLADAEFRARRIAARMAVCLQGALLLKDGDPSVADAFSASRLGGDWAGAFGTLPPGLSLGAIVERATPRLGA
jgi:putative acyl-CoA dehydrogenase